MGYFCLGCPATFCTSSVALAEVERLIEDCISKRGVHLIAVELGGEGGGQSLDVYIDSEPGITTGVCSEVSREVDRLIESAGIVRGPYRLTVSSPGIARPLKYLWQYKKHIGRQLELTLRSQDGTTTVAGTLVSIDDTAVAIRSAKGSDPQTIAVDGIVEARVRAPW